MDAERFEIPRWECFQLLRSRVIGRLCVIDNGYPLALPVNYRFDGDEDDAKLVIRVAPDTLLGRYEGLTSLEVDDIDVAAGTAWTVIVRGKTHRVFGEHDLADPAPLLPGRVRWLTVQPSAVTGRRFVVSESEDGLGVDWLPRE